MYPSIPLPFFDVGLRTYVLVHGLAYIAFAVTGRWFTRSVPEFGKHWWRLAALLAVCDLGVAHVAHAVLDAGSSALAEAAAWWPLGGGYWGGPLFVGVAFGLYWLIYKFPSSPCLDAVAIGWLIVVMFFKMACLLHGCCYGPRCSPGWPLSVDGRHPLPLYESFWYLAGTIVLYVLFRRKLLRGRLLLLMGLFYGVAQIVVQPYRSIGQLYVGSDSIVSLRQIAALPVVTFCFVMLWFEFFAYIRQRKGPLRLEREAPAP